MIFVELGPEALKLSWYVKVRVNDILFIVFSGAKEISITHVVPASLIVSQLTILVLVDI